MTRPIVIPGVIVMFLLVMASCQNKGKITIEFEKADGIKINTPMELNAVKAGSVSKISRLENNQILVEVRLEDGIAIPGDSKFIFVEDNVMIIIERGQSTDRLIGGEHLQGIHRRSNIIDIF